MARPFALKLTQRGFYSEVNNLLNVMLYGLIRRRRLIVDETDFEGQVWSNIFLSKLPTGHIEGVHPDWVIWGSELPRFWRIGKTITRRHRKNMPVAVPSIGIFGTVRSAKRDLAGMIFAPRATAPERPGSYASIHVRRGDKILDAQGFPAEGEDIAVKAYLAELRNKAPDLRDVFVMTDDYTSVEQLRDLAPDYRFDTLCTPEERGYDQATFSARTPSEKAAHLERLVMETQIAAGSDLFLGGFKSNVGRFITLIHKQPDRCFSMDAQKVWLPD